jgi:hypothetical protein
MFRSVLPQKCRRITARIRTYIRKSPAKRRLYLRGRLERRPADADLSKIIYHGEHRGHGGVSKADRIPGTETPDLSKKKWVVAQLHKAEFQVIGIDCSGYIDSEALRAKNRKQ